MEPSYVFCEKLINGRLSFQGINPAIEKLMEAKENAKVETKQEADISDEQMAVRWKKMRTKFDNVKNKHKKPQHRQISNASEDEPLKKKPKFLKPAD